MQNIVHVVFHAFEVYDGLVIVDLFQRYSDQIFCEFDGVDTHGLQHITLVDDFLEHVEHLVVNHTLSKEDHNFPFRNRCVQCLLEVQQHVEHIPGSIQGDELVVYHQAIRFDVSKEVVFEDTAHHDLTFTLKL